MKKIILDGNSLNLESAYRIANGNPVGIASKAKSAIEKSRKIVDHVVQSQKPVYGINTGFGYYANTNINPSELLKLQTNLVKSHAAGYGNPLSIPETRLAMVLRLNVLLKGFTGVRYTLCEALLALIENEIYPQIPEYGSVGASGDLAPLAHLALALIGCGNVHYKGKIITAKEALEKAKLTPLTLAEKEGLSLINGTQIMLSVGGIALFECLELLEWAEKICALSLEGLVGNVSAFNPFIHQVRNQVGQIVSAKKILEQLKNSPLFKSSTVRKRIQDPYSLRCAPQVHGTSRDALGYAKTIIERELNGATDNPLIDPEDGAILSGGNFHGQPIAMAFDFAAMALSEIGNISERRLECLLNPTISGLNAFLSPQEGLQSGYMAIQYLAGSLVNENKLLANPASTDSIPGNVGIEDHVSMGMTSARKLRKIVANTRAILAAEAVAAAQAIDLRGIKQHGKGTTETYQAIRALVRPLTEDRIVAEDIAAVIHIFTQGGACGSTHSH